MKNFANTFFEKVGGYIAIVFTLLQVIGFFINSIPVEAILIGSLIIPLRLFYLKRFEDASKNFARVYLWAGWDLSTVVLPTFMYDSYATMVYKKMVGAEIPISEADVTFTISIGVFALFLCFISSIWWRNEKSSDVEYVSTLTRSQVIFWGVTLSLVSFGATTIANIFSLGVYGESSIYLPFKMTAVINYFAFGFSWFLNFYLLDTFYQKRISIVFPITMIVLMAILSSMASLSKGQLISPIVSIIIYLIISKRFSNAILFSSIALFLGVFVIASFLSGYRDSRQAIYTKGFGAEAANYSMMKFTHRIFSDGITFMKFHANADSKGLNDMLKQWNYSVSDVHTYSIDGKPQGTLSTHSTGCVNLPAAYLFGYPFFIIFTILASLCASYIDYGLPRSTSIFASTIFRAYAAYAIARVYIAVSALEMLTRAYNWSFSFISFPILTIIIYILYLKFFCAKTQRSDF